MFDSVDEAIDDWLAFRAWELWKGGGCHVQPHAVWFLLSKSRESKSRFAEGVYALVGPVVIVVVSSMSRRLQITCMRVAVNVQAIWT